MGILERMRLDGKISMVTGGARGIGKAIASALAEAGSNLVIIDLDVAEAQRVASEIQKNTGATALAMEANVTNEQQINKAVDIIVKDFGRLDVAFCNAGICKNIPASEMSLHDWQEVIDVNLTGVFLTAQAAGRAMISQGGGSIINTASMSAHIVNVPQPQCAYNASKAGVVQLTRSLAIEWAQHKVRVNSISPGYIGTELTLNSEALKPLIAQWNAIAPLGRMGQPEELQAIAVYLAGDTSPFTTGADFLIDGAFTCF
ncbi:MAG: SDR family oxidoreductase [Christensenellales bacterium]|jgi:NAD(P)-dependent dehydrogenase (short-subunit alcohol dehydrogenase family)